MSSHTNFTSAKLSTTVITDVHKPSNDNFNLCCYGPIVSKEITERCIELHTSGLQMQHQSQK